MFYCFFSAAPAIYLVVSRSYRSVLKSGNGGGKSGCVGSLQLCGRIGECHRVFDFNCRTSGCDQSRISGCITHCFDIAIQSSGCLKHTLVEQSLADIIDGLKFKLLTLSGDFLVDGGDVTQIEINFKGDILD